MDTVSKILRDLFCVARRGKSDESESEKDETNSIISESEKYSENNSNSESEKDDDNEKWEKETNIDLDKFLQDENESDVLLVDELTEYGNLKVVVKKPTSQKCRRGLLIAFEGGDRAGKSTQIKLLKRNLIESEIDCKVEIFKFPSWKIISDYLNANKEMNDKAIHLLFSANRWDKSDEIIAKLNDGVHILLDRWSYSGVSYSAAKPGMNLEWCKMSERGLPAADLVCYLKVSEETAMKRSHWGESRYDNVDFQVKVKENFNLLRNERWVSFEEGGSIEEIEQNIFKVVRSILTLDYEFTRIHRLYIENCFCQDKLSLRLKKVYNVEKHNFESYGMLE